ncbi:MAG: alcohol dehydrogenase class IV [Halioglobus sp.]|jgi:alcohol dehydrogenase class IV
MDLDYLTNNWNYPTAVSVGVGSIAQLADHCMARGIRAPLLVTDPGLAELEMTGAVVQQLKNSGLEVAIYSGIKSNPTGENVDAGADAFRKGSHDGVIAFGGGSALDAGKSIALIAEHHRPVFEFADEADTIALVDETRVAPIIAVPTTAGTGSEVGRAAVIMDTQQQRKRIIFHPRLLPVQVILDPELTVGLPPHITAATGMDALSHNLEALSADSFHPMAMGIAVEGIRLVREFLPRAFADGTDLEARTQMLVASSMGATAFQRGLGAMHALSHPLGAIYDAHHGLLNAIVMPYVLKENESAIAPTLVRAARYLDLPNKTFDGFLDWVLGLRAELGIPHSLAEIGIDAVQAIRVGEMAVADPTAGGNPIALTARQYTKMFERAVEGAL